MVQGFFSRPEREGVRNRSAGARGIFITPSADRAGFVVGAEHADGLLLVRHGMEWSDPIFVTLSNFDVGFLAGVSRSELLMYVLTDRAVRQFLSGAGRVSGSGGFVLGDWGVGGLGAGGISGGVQALIIET